MNRMRKSWLLLAGMAAIGAALTGCGAKPTAESVMKAMTEAAQKAKYTEMDWNMDMDLSMTMEVMGLDTKIAVDAAGKTQMENETKLSATTADLKADVMGESVNVALGMYTEMADEKNMDVYMQLQPQDEEASWVKMSQEIPDEESDANNKLNEMMASSFTLADKTVEEDGKTCYQLEGDIAWEDLIAALQAMPQFSEALEQAGTEADLGILDGKAFHVVELVGKDDSLPVKVELTLTNAAPAEAASETTAAAADKAAETTAAEGETEAPEDGDDMEADTDTEFALNFDTLSLTATYTYPESLAIEIPAEGREAAVDVSDMNDLSDVFGSETTNTDPYPDGEGSMFEKVDGANLIIEFAPDEQEAQLWSDDTADVRVQRVYTGAFGIYVDIEATNKTEQAIGVDSRGIAVNGVMTEEGVFLTLEPGETKTGCAYLPVLADAGEPARLSLRLAGYDQDAYGELFATDILEVKVSEAASTADLREGGTTVYDGDSLQVTAYPLDTSSGFMTTIPLAITNRKDSVVSVSSSSITVAGQEAESYLYADIFPGTTIYTSVNLYDDELKEKGIEAVSDVHMGLELTDPVTYEVTETIEEVVIP